MRNTRKVYNLQFGRPTTGVFHRIGLFHSFEETEYAKETLAEVLPPDTIFTYEEIDLPDETDYPKTEAGYPTYVPYFAEEAADADSEALAEYLGDDLPPVPTSASNFEEDVISPTGSYFPEDMLDDETPLAEELNWDYYDGVDYDD